MTLDALFFQLKHGYILDNKTDANGQFVSKGGSSGEKEEEPKKKGVAAKLRKDFDENTKKYLNTDFKNASTGIAARFSTESQKELKSRTVNSKENGFTLQEHFEMANQIKKLFENADLIKEHPDGKHGEKNVKIKRFLSKPTKLKSGKTAQACITVKYSIDKNKHLVYSLEAMDIKNALEKTRAKGQPKNSVCPHDNTVTRDGLKINRYVAQDKFKDGTQYDALITAKETIENGQRLYSLELDEINHASKRFETIDKSIKKDFPAVTGQKDETRTRQGTPATGSLNNTITHDNTKNQIT